MSKLENFSVSPIEGIDDYIQIKSKDEKWKDFPACCLPKSFVESVVKVKDLKIYNDDVILCGFPRSGTTLMQEMIWLIMNDFNFEKAMSVITDLRFPLFEGLEFIQKFYEGKISMTFDDLERPRTMKTHLPVQLLPDEVWEKKPKIIHISRDARDVAVSNYHFVKNMLHIDVGLENYLKNFLDGNVFTGPYREHCINFLTLPNYSNILYLTYEWVIENMEEAILRVAEFLDKEVSDDEMKNLKEHLKFDSMKKNKACNNESFMKRMNEINKSDKKVEGFIRKGNAAGYKNEMPQEFIDKFDQWMAEAFKLKCF